MPSPSWSTAQEMCFILNRQFAYVSSLVYPQMLPRRSSCVDTVWHWCERKWTSWQTDVGFTVPGLTRLYTYRHLTSESMIHHNHFSTFLFRIKMDPSWLFWYVYKKTVIDLTESNIFLLLGWLSPRGRGSSQPRYLTPEKRLIPVFSTWPHTNDASLKSAYLCQCLSW